LGKEVRKDAQDDGEEDNHRQEEWRLQEEGKQVEDCQGASGKTLAPIFRFTSCPNERAQ